MGWVTRVASAGETVDPLLHHGVFTSQVTPSLHCKSTMYLSRGSGDVPRPNDRRAGEGNEFIK